jgi:hypothetical protein
MRVLLVAALLLGACGGTPDYVLQGRWQGIVELGAFEGQQIVQRFNAGGEYRILVASTEFVGTWSLAGDVVSISDGGCVTTDPGQFQLKWVDAATFIYHIVDDACGSRGDTLNGVTMTQPFM